MPRGSRRHHLGLRAVESLDIDLLAAALVGHEGEGFRIGAPRRRTLFSTEVSLAPRRPQLLSAVGKLGHVGIELSKRPLKRQAAAFADCHQRPFDRTDPRSDERGVALDFSRIRIDLQRPKACPARLGRRLSDAVDETSIRAPTQGWLASILKQALVLHHHPRRAAAEVHRFNKQLWSFSCLPYAQIRDALAARRPMNALENISFGGRDDEVICSLGESLPEDPFVVNPCIRFPIGRDARNHRIADKWAVVEFLDSLPADFPKRVAVLVRRPGAGEQGFTVWEPRDVPGHDIGGELDLFDLRRIDAPQVQARLLNVSESRAVWR